MYQNWSSVTGRNIKNKQARIQKNLVNRLTKGSPEREHKINYVIGSARGGPNEKGTISNFQGCKDPYFVTVKPKNLRLKVDFENKTNTFSKDFKEFHN